MARLGYADSVRRLVEQGHIDEGVGTATPPTRRGEARDDIRGITFYKTRVADVDFSNLTLPGLNFGRSEIANCSFRNADLRHSTLCWNDFIEVDFRGACLADCDLRAAIFDRCNFEGADMQGALVNTGGAIYLSEAQRRAVIWSDEEPDGG